MTKPGPDERWQPGARPGSASQQSARAVIERVAADEGLSLEQLRSPSRRRRLVETRRRAALAARRETPASLPEIGRILNRHHTTVLHHVRRTLEVGASV